MKIELKNTDFKYLYELCDKVFSEGSGYGDIIRKIIVGQLKSQYNKAFLKYKNEKQKFEVGEKIKFRWPRGDWIDGKIFKISRLSSGKYRYIIKYEDTAEDYHYDNGEEIENGMVINYTNPMTEKNIRKL